MNSNITNLSTPRQQLVLAHSNPRLGLLQTRLLQRLGWEVHVTNSGETARELVAYLKPAAVLLNTELADESGWLTCAKLVQRWQGVPVILMAKHVNDYQMAFADVVGASGVVPYTANLLDVLNNLPNILKTPGVGHN